MKHKLIARFAGISAGAAMVLGFAGTAGAQQSVAELQALIMQLTQQLAALQGGASAGAAITSDLTVGSTGSQVVTLQNALVAQGYLSVPAGTALGYFGELTKAAVARWQAAKGLPATGYFGPLSRAAFGGGVTTGGTTGGGTVVGGGSAGGALQGGEGTLDVNGNLGNVEDEVDEGDEDVNVLGIEVEADDSDMMIERFDVELTVGSGGSSQLEDYITEVSIWLDGQRLATQDVDEADEDSDDVFSFRFTGLRGVVREGDEAELFVAVSAVNNVDSGDTDVDISVDMPADGIRAVDAAGITDTYGTAGEVTAETFSIAEPTGGTLTISDASSNPLAMNVEVDDENDTDDVTVLIFDLEAEDSDVTVDAIPVIFTSSVDGVDNVINRATLWHGSTQLDSQSVTATGTTFLVTFDDLDLEIEEDDTETLTVKVDVNDTDATFVTGTTLEANIIAAQADTMDAEDAQGDSLAAGDISGSADGEVMTFLTIGPELDLSSITESLTTSDNAPDLGTYVFKFDVTAFGDDIYLSATSTSGETNAVTYTLTGGTVSSSTLACSGCEEESDAFLVSENGTEEFTLTVIVTGNSSFTDVEVTGIKWGDSADSNTENTATVEWESDTQFLSAT